MGSCEVPQTIWVRSVQPFDFYFGYKRTDRQAQYKYRLDIICNYSCKNKDGTSIKRQIVNVNTSLEQVKLIFYSFISIANICIDRMPKMYKDLRLFH